MTDFLDTASPLRGDQYVRMQQVSRLPIQWVLGGGVFCSRRRTLANNFVNGHRLFRQQREGYSSLW